ncbi:hypothetical protein D3C83_69380 [compost metagenome]
MPTQAPIQALRPRLTASATISAGITSAGQMRSREPKRMRATAAHMTSISVPE